ncbi:hypothetical protein NQ317_006633 [Molorchus minor]|uniref:Uncharacterized protein n=1 Tax=Molorchus minor TaxID=1323400 RepID=A0ABQ9IVQ2_9CUCU|nr:hypothetical protein NQ317_006633 [Molorchus minor]
MNNGNKTLVQSTIFCYAPTENESKSNKNETTKKSYILTVIEIDSDSDSPVDKDVEKPETTKRKISVPFSDDDDEDPNNSSEIVQKKLFGINFEVPNYSSGVTKIYNEIYILLEWSSTWACHPNNKNDAVSECESITSNDSQRTILLNTSISPKRSDRVKIIDNINLSTQQSEGVPSSNCAKNEVSGTERTPKKQKLCQAGKKKLNKERI